MKRVYVLDRKHHRRGTQTTHQLVEAIIAAVSSLTGEKQLQSPVAVQVANVYQSMALTRELVRDPVRLIASLREPEHGRRVAVPSCELIRDGDQQHLMALISVEVEAVYGHELSRRSSRKA